MVLDTRLYGRFSCFGMWNLCPNVVFTFQLHLGNLLVIYVFIYFLTINSKFHRPAPAITVYCSTQTLIFSKLLCN
jgi:hypothetical protein